MKRTRVAIIVLTAGIMMGISGAQKPGMGKGMMGGSGMGMGGMMGMQMMSDSCPMGGMFMHGMMGRSMVSTEDGGVVVMIANQLYKYDKNLVLKKEAEIKIDTAKMRDAMMGMSRACRMMQGTRDSSAAKSGGPMGSVSPASPPAPEGKAANQVKSGIHESHH